MTASWPVAEIGMHDDWSYVRTVQVLAETGHVVFNGWGAPLLGVQLLPAALFVKAFGFSFTIVRLTSMLVALITTALIQRTIVRCGIRDWNASIVTITLMASPVFLPVATGFLSDMWCLLGIVACLYCCLRALSAVTDEQAIGWIYSAALGNALLGTSRQIAWLGVLTMVPSTLWLLRRRRRILTAGILAFAGGCIIILLSMVWFIRHPYTLHEHLGIFQPKFGLHHPSLFVRPALELPMLTLPLLLMFIPVIFRCNRWGLYAAATGFALFCIAAGYEYHLHTLHTWYVPFMIQGGDIFGPNGVYNRSPVWGTRPPAMPAWVRAGFSIGTVLGLVSWLAVTIGKQHDDASSAETGSISWRNLTTLLAPFAAGYLAFLLPRASLDITIDRYLEPLLFIALIFLARQYQDRVAPALPKLSLMIALLIAGYSVATLQDVFAMYRAIVVAANEVTASGVPRSHFDGGF